jgi:dipeptidyl aminopeptidase/acylaminoacyl peptidase
MRLRMAAAPIAWAVFLACSASSQGQGPGFEAEDEPSIDSPQQRAGRGGQGAGLVFKDRVTPRWFAENTRFWYRNDLTNRGKEFILVDAEKGTRGPAFDHARLAASLSKAGVAAQGPSLPFDEIAFVDDGKAIIFQADGKTWRCDLGSYEVATANLEPPRPPAAAGEGPARRQARGDGEAPARLRIASPDGKWTAFVKDHDVYARSEADGKEVRLSDDGKEDLTYTRLSWSPDSQSLVAFRVEPGDREEVHLVQSSPPGGGRAKLQSRPYPLPGDKFESFELNLFDVAAGKKIRPEVDRVDFGAPRVRWRPDGRHFTYMKRDRGHQRFRLVEVDARTGQSRNLIDEKSDTFIWSAHAENLTLELVNWLDKSDEILYVSERDGWRHLYLIDAAKGEVKNQVTKGEYVVRGVDLIDQEQRQVWFRASGKVPGQDPYFVHTYRVNFDGTGLVVLTEGDGNHSVRYSPDRKYLIDSYSRVDLPPVNVLRRTSDGSQACKLEEADASALAATGWKPPEVFVAKGRDGKTDIWGIICRPKDLDPSKKYPVIESIYAGPQGSFVPKDFSQARRFSTLTDLGFIVVQMDGMGTANRSKAFHDVCWKNLKDAGFPDRILWHQAAAKAHPEMDLTRVGIYGTSAGGQNSTGGVLFHPEFYKVAASACGCHDNRMDKASWNEQWMGYPVGPQYAESSNIDNAHRLRGKLLLIVGEMDTNVPPESTYRLCDALIKADKDFDFVMVPNANHGMGGAYGQRRMNDFFVRHLLKAVEKVDPSVARTALADEKPKDEKPKEMAKPPEEIVNLDLEDVNLDKSEMRGVIERYQVDLRSFQRTLPPASSPERDERVRDFANKWLGQLAKLDFYALGLDGQVDYILFKNYLKHDLESIILRVKDRADAAPFVTFGKTILDLDQARRELKPQPWGKVAGTLTDLTKEIAEARKALEAKPRSELRVKKAVANRAVANVEGLRATLRDWNGFYDGYDPLYAWWNAEPYKAADAALQGYATFLRDRLGAVGEGGGMRGGGGGGGGGGRGGRAGGGFGAGGQGPPAPTPAPDRDAEIIGNPIGREALLNELAYEMIPYSPEELVEIAEREFAWCEAEMKKASKEMGFGDDWKAALEKVKTLHVEPGQQPAMIRDLALEAIDYIDKNNLVTVPPLCRDSWRMAMMPPDRQLVNPFFTGGETITVSYPVGSMTHEQKMMTMRGNNVHFSRATVHHELIPGHHLEGYMSSRYKTYRSPFQTAFVTEGWALYWELLLWDRGFARSPEDRVGMLFWRMHRCARIIFSLGFHLEKMTPKECIDFLVDRVGHERDNATGEVRRSFSGGYGPLYQAAYLLGGMQLHALHRELVESGKMTDRAFHDAILKENRIPVEMIRAVLTKQKLGGDFISSWKFKEPAPAED